MRKLFESADRYLDRSDWKDLTLIKFCLCSMGIVIGASLPEKYRKPAVCGASGVFVLTYVPLMAKYFKTVKEMTEEKE